MLLSAFLKKSGVLGKRSGAFFVSGSNTTRISLRPSGAIPDLATHRMIKAFLTKKKATQQERKTTPAAKPGSQAEQSSMREIKAVEVEREVANLRRAQFMADKVGKEYSGHVVISHRFRIVCGAG